MTRTTYCPSCQIPLNVPAAAGNKRLKCPQCGTRFHPDGPLARPPSSTPGFKKPSPASSIFATEPPEVYLPGTKGDLRESFDLPLLDDSKSDGPPRRPVTSDALALFREDSTPKKPASAPKIRPKARTCDTCDTFIPIGTTVCPRCGTDAELGRPLVVQEIVDEIPGYAQTAEAGIPAGVFLIGSLTLMASLVLALITLIALSGLGAIALGMLCLFGIFASIQFLRGKSARLLLLALGLAAAVDVVALMVLPVWQATEVAAAPVEIPAPRTPADEEPVATEEEPKTESLNQVLSENGANTKLAWGILLLLVDAGVMVYLSTAGIRRHFDHQPSVPPFGIG